METETNHPTIRDFGDGRHLVAHVPTGHPSIAAIRPAAVWVRRYYDLRRGAKVCAYDLFFAYGDDRAQVEAWLTGILANSHNE